MPACKKTSVVWVMNISDILENDIWKYYNNGKKIVSLKDRPSVSKFNYVDIVIYLLKVISFDETTIDILWS